MMPKGWGISALIATGAGVLLSGCLQRQTATPPPVLRGPDQAAAIACDTHSRSGLIGQHFTRLADQPMAQDLRILHPMQPVTPDMNPTRLNARVDAQGMIQSLFCG